MDWSQDSYDPDDCGSFDEWEDVSLPCGLRASQVSDILFRELTPEDYDMLLQLDETVVKAPSVSRSSVDKLPTARHEDFCGESCTVCLVALEKNDSVSVLPCRHLFHHVCISKWLTEQRPVCPLCSTEVFPK